MDDFKLRRSITGPLLIAIVLMLVTIAFQLLDKQRLYDITIIQGEVR